MFGRGGTRWPGLADDGKAGRAWGGPARLPVAGSLSPAGRLSAPEAGTPRGLFFDLFLWVLLMASRTHQVWVPASVLVPRALTRADAMSSPGLGFTWTLFVPSKASLLDPDAGSRHRPAGADEGRGSQMMLPPLPGRVRTQLPAASAPSLDGANQQTVWGGGAHTRLFLVQPSGPAGHPE